MHLAVKLGSFIEDFEIGEFTVDKIQALEEAIHEANQLYLSQIGESGVSATGKLYAEQMAVDDALYDRALEILKQLKPDSELVKEIYEVQTGEESVIPQKYLELLEADKMKSIETVKSFDTAEFQTFASKLEQANLGEYIVLCSLKLNGWGVQLFYEYGEFKSAYSRARSSKGLDITHVMREVLEKDNLLGVDMLKNVPLCSIRGELNLLVSNLEQARQFNPNIVSPLSAINSLRGSKMPVDAYRLMDFNAYRYVEHDFEFATRFEQYQYLESLGFKVPPHFRLGIEHGDLAESFSSLALETMAELRSASDYYSDGVVIQIDSNSIYQSLGGTSRIDYGAVALKMGLWEQNDYHGFVQYVSWSRGTTKISPVAIVALERDMVEFVVDGVSYQGLFDLADNCPVFEDIKDDLDSYVVNYSDLGIPTAVAGHKSNVVRRVPLYNVNGLLELGVKPNGVLHFKYGGESGVVPCDASGNLYKAVVDLNQVLGGAK